MSVTASPPTVLLTRTIPGPQAAVYDAWIAPDRFARWFAPHTYAVVDMQLDVRVGGQHRTTVVGPDGGRHTTSGVYTELDPPHRLALTWNYQGDHPDAEATESLLSVEFVALDADNTEVRLSHAQMLTERGQDNVRAGWQGCLDKLEDLFAVTHGASR